MKLNILFDKISDLYQKYLNLDYKKRLLIIGGLALLLRLVFMQQLTMELDTYYYAKLAQDVKTGIVSGKIFSQPVTHENYYGIEYRTPLYAFLSGITAVVAGNVEVSLLIVSLIAGVLLVIPVFLMAKSLWGEYAGDIAALMICFSPPLIMHSTMGRTESLYVLMYALALYFTLLAYEKGKWQDYIVSGIFWGLAYQTRFESLTGILVTAFLFTFCIVRKKSKKAEMTKAFKGLAVFLATVFIVMLPYLLIVYSNTGKFSITSPSKTLLDLQESFWITSGMEGGYYSFNYYYGDPGENSWHRLKELIPEDAEASFEKNLGLILPAVIKAVPLNLWYLVSNFNLCLIVFLILPFILGWKIKDPRIAIIWMYFLTAIPIIFLSYWSPDPRYYAYLIPLVTILSMGTVYKLYNLEDMEFNIKDKAIRTLVLAVLFPASLYCSWYFLPGNTLIHTWFQIPLKTMVQPLHKSLVILLFIFAGTSLLALSCAFIWKRIPLALQVPVFCLGLCVIGAGFTEPKITLPARIFEFFSSGQFELIRSLVAWFFVVGIILEIFFQLIQRAILPERFRKQIMTVCVMIILVISLQNGVVINKARSAYRYLNYHEKAAEVVKQQKSGKVAVMSRHPHDAFEAGTLWQKIPPVYDINGFSALYGKNPPQYVIVDDQPLFEGNFMSVYPFFQIMKAKGELSLVDYYEKFDIRYSDRKIRIWIYKVNRTNVRQGQKEAAPYLTLPVSTHLLTCPAAMLRMPLAAIHIWQSFRNNSLNNGRSVYRGPVKNVKISWKYKAGHEIFSSPAITKEGTIIFGCDDSNLYALDKKGRQLWKFAADYYVSSSPSISDQGFIYFGSDDQHLYSLTNKGKLRWGFQTGYFISSGVKFTSSGDVVFGGEDKNLYCITQQGKLKWKFKTNGEITATPAVFKAETLPGKKMEIIIVPSHDGFVYAVTDKGKELWKYKAGSEILSSPAIDDKGNIYVCNRRGKVTSLTSSGKKKWMFSAGGEIASSPAINTDGSILFGCRDHNIYKISSGGKLIWKFEAGYDIESSPVVDAAGNIYFGSHDRCIYGINSKGKLLWKIETGGAVYSSPAIAADGTIYVGSMDKYMYAVNGK
ncbi:MAG: PQQ-binding-like beta-propeller repeat protein [Firmicutes bacterium]|nr:PQQ-binding-like beta-propeller repeat protein [Bacillota bacterium]